MSKGKLIVLEGLDGAGKATQSEMLTDYLNKTKHPAALRHYPDYESASGKLIRNYLDNKEVFYQKTINMIYSVNRYETRKWIKYLLNRGTIVVLDRYYYSNMAYGSNYGETMQSIAAMDSEMPEPDKVFFIDISPEESLKRSGKDPDRNESFLPLLKSAREKYYFMSLHEYDNWVMVNGEESKEEIHEQIVAVVEKLFKNAN